MLIFLKDFERFNLGRMVLLSIQVAGIASSFSLGSLMTVWKQVL